jgi:hypothetical protein
MEQHKSLSKMTKKDEQLFSLIKQGWIPYLVVELNHSKGIYSVTSGSTIGCYHIVRNNEILGLTCEHEYGSYNDHHTCSHIRAVQEYLLSADGCVSFDQEVHSRCHSKSLKATKTKKQWEWLITDIRGQPLGCMGVTVEPGSPIQWWTTYEGNHAVTWDNCNQALEYLLAAVSF